VNGEISQSVASTTQLKNREVVVNLFDLVQKCAFCPIEAFLKNCQIRIILFVDAERKPTVKLEHVSSNLNLGNYPANSQLASFRYFASKASKSLSYSMVTPTSSRPFSRRYFWKPSISKA